MRDYQAIWNTGGRLAAMRACATDIRNILRRNWDLFAAADFYNEMVNTYGNTWKPIRWTYNYEILCIIVETTKNDIVFMARYDPKEKRGYRQAKYITTKQD